MSLSAGFQAVGVIENLMRQILSIGLLTPFLSHPFIREVSFHYTYQKAQFKCTKELYLLT